MWPPNHRNCSKVTLCNVLMAGLNLLKGLVCFVAALEPLFFFHKAKPHRVSEVASDSPVGLQLKAFWLF